MTDTEEHNERAIANFKQSPDFKTHKIYCILSGDQEGRSKVFQSAMFSPAKIAEKLFQVGNAIIQSLKKPN
jgi:hypothetical protein